MNYLFSSMNAPVLELSGAVQTSLLCYLKFKSLGRNVKGPVMLAGTEQMQSGALDQSSGDW